MILLKPIDLPGSIRGFTVWDKGEYLICINEKLDQEQRVKTFKHELDHIKNGDFYKKCNVNELEMIRHNL